MPTTLSTAEVEVSSELVAEINAITTDETSKAVSYEPVAFTREGRTD